MNRNEVTSQQADPQQHELLRVCRIGRAQGLKGEVNVWAFTDEPERRFAPGSDLYTKDGTHTYTVIHSRTFKDRWILQFEGVGNRNASEALNGLELYAEADDRNEMAEEDAWYPKDLIGLDVRMDDELINGIDPAKAGTLVGKVVDVIDGPAQSLLKIRLDTSVIERKDGSFISAASASDRDPNEGTVIKTALVPFVDELVPYIDLDERYLTIDPPIGLIPGL